MVELGVTAVTNRQQGAVEERYGDAVEVEPGLREVGKRRDPLVPSRAASTTCTPGGVAPAPPPIKRCHSEARSRQE